MFDRTTGGAFGTQLTSQQKLPDARLILFPDSGHGSHFQFPEEFAEAVARFLAAE